MPILSSQIEQLNARGRLMSYLKEFQTQIENNDFAKFMQLWEEYCTSDVADVEEFTDILKSVKNSDFAKLFGKYIETALPLWQTIQDQKESYSILSLLIDIENTNSPKLADVSLNAIKQKYPNDPHANERLRLIGLRTKDIFQGALANYDLLAHMQKGKFVFHTGGWGTGEIIDVSPIREQMVIEFENIRGRKDLSFANAFKTLIPLPDEHFLARRFSNPDLLEKDAKENPVAIIRLMLRDLGPKDAAEIKDELCELVIPEADWTKWWQNTRAKIKKDTMIQTPESAKQPFRLRKSELSHADRLQQAVHHKTDFDEIIQTTYNYVRDLPDMLKNKEVKATLKERLENMLKLPDLKPVQILQLHILLENHFNNQSSEKALQEIITKEENLQELLNEMDIVAFKKRALVAIKDYRKDSTELFLSMLFMIPQAALRDYILKELSGKETAKLMEAKIRSLLEHPTQNPEIFVWYFQKVVNLEDVPFANKEGQCQFFDSFLVLFNYLENKANYRDLLKKMYQILSGKRYAVVRAIIENTSMEYVKEFLLLASKCQSLSDHDIKILRSLAEVVHPTLATTKKGHSKVDSNTLWTTEEGYLKTQDKIRHIGTLEIVENAREIEAARALGDLRENSEYKFALEKRARLQGDLKMLSEQFNRARIITKDDVPTEEVGIGTIIDAMDPQGKKVTYTILGPWDADVDKNILSFQSKLALSMIGTRIGEKFKFRDDEYTVVGLRSYLDK